MCQIRLCSGQHDTLGWSCTWTPPKPHVAWSTGAGNVCGPRTLSAPVAGRTVLYREALQNEDLVSIQTKNCSDILPMEGPFHRSILLNNFRIQSNLSLFGAISNLNRTKPSGMDEFSRSHLGSTQIWFEGYELM